MSNYYLDEDRFKEAMQNMSKNSGFRIPITVHATNSAVFVKRVKEIAEENKELDLNNKSLD